MRAQDESGILLLADLERAGVAHDLVERVKALVKKDWRARRLNRERQAAFWAKRRADAIARR